MRQGEIRLKAIKKGYFLPQCFLPQCWLSVQNDSKTSCEREAYPYLHGTVPNRTAPKSPCKRSLYVLFCTYWGVLHLLSYHLCRISCENVSSIWKVCSVPKRLFSFFLVINLMEFSHASKSVMLSSYRYQSPFLFFFNSEYWPISPCIILSYCSASLFLCEFNLSLEG